MHTRLKLLCDRLISVLNEGAKYVGRRCVVAVPYGVEGWQGYGVEATVSFARFLHLDVVGVLPVHAANPGEAVRPEFLSRARELACRLLPKNEAELPAEPEDNVRQATNAGDITCSACGSGIFRIANTGEIQCVICGTSAKLKMPGTSDDATVQCTWAMPEPFRYSAAGMAEHAHRLEAIKAEFVARRQELLALRKPYRDER